MYTNYEEYCKIVQEKSVIRNLIDTATEILNESYGQYDDVESVIEVPSRVFLRFHREKNAGTLSPSAKPLVKPDAD